MNELITWVNQALEQIFAPLGTSRYQKKIVKSVNQPQDGLFITQKATKAMAAYGVSRDSVRDALAHGENKKSYIKVRSYNGYEIGITYGKGKFGNEQVIYSVWKQPIK